MEEINGEFIKIFSDSGEIPRELLEYHFNKGADVNTKGRYGWTALIFFVLRRDFLGVQNLISIFRESIDLDIRDPDGDTALIISVSTGYSHISDLLLENGADFDVVNNSGKKYSDFFRTEKELQDFEMKMGMYIKG